MYTDIYIYMHSLETVQLISTCGSPFSSSHPPPSDTPVSVVLHLSVLEWPGIQPPVCLLPGARSLGKHQRMPEISTAVYMYDLGT